MCFLLIGFVFSVYCRYFHTFRFKRKKSLESEFPSMYWIKHKKWHKTPHLNISHLNRRPWTTSCEMFNILPSGNVPFSSICSSASVLFFSSSVWHRAELRAGVETRTRIGNIFKGNKKNIHFFYCRYWPHLLEPFNQKYCCYSLYTEQFVARRCVVRCFCVTDLW